MIPVGMDAAGEEGAGRLLDAQALCGDGDASVGADAGLRACAPDVGPPRDRKIARNAIHAGTSLMQKA